MRERKYSKSIYDYRAIGSFPEKQGTAINFWEKGVGAERATGSGGREESGKTANTLSGLHEV